MPEKGTMLFRLETDLSLEAFPKMLPLSKRLAKYWPLFWILNWKKSLLLYGLNKNPFFAIIQTFGHFNQAQNCGKDLTFNKSECYFNLSIQNTLHEKCNTRKFSFCAFFKTMANFWRVTMKMATSSEPPSWFWNFEVLHKMEI